MVVLQAKLERYRTNLDQTRHEAEEDANSLELEIREKMGEIVELDLKNKELLAKIDELQSDMKVLNEDVMTRDDRIDKLNEVSIGVIDTF